MSAIIILCSQICHNHVKTTHYTELNFAQIVPYHNMDTWKSCITWTSTQRDVSTKNFPCLFADKLI